MRKLIPFFALLLLSACNQSEDALPVEPDAPVVTGFRFRDNLGNSLANVGNPNIKTDETKNNQRFGLNCFPNPARYQQTIYYNKPFSYSGRIWITAARTDQTQMQYTFAGSASAIATGQPLRSIPISSGDGAILLDLSDFPPGAYRVYAQFGDVLLWDNILLQK
jgi:hypothetical protein